MKNFILSLVAPAFFTLAAFGSCVRTIGGDVAGSVPASLNVEIGVPNNTRAVAANAPGDDVRNFSVFITDQSNEIAWKGYSAAGTPLTGASAVKVTTAAKEVYVVANAGDLTAQISNLAGLNSFIADLGGTDAQGRQADVRWSTGVSTSPLNFIQNGTKFSATTTVPLRFIAARVTLKIKLAGDMSYYDPAATDGSLVLTGVSVLNARGESKLFGGSLIPAAYSAGKMFYMGLAGNNFAYYPADGTFTLAADLLSDAMPATLENKTFYHYVFENDAATPADLPTIITLVGRYDEKEIYFPVHLASYEQFKDNAAVSSITRGNSYDIVVKLSGDPRKNGDYPGNTGGGDDPYQPSVTASVDVSITAATWTPVTFEKEF